jgi:hypothetical protein
MNLNFATKSLSKTRNVAQSGAKSRKMAQYTAKYGDVTLRFQ